MLNKDILDTLKKHLADIDGTAFRSEMTRKSKLKIHKFGEDMKSANELIGALQILDITLKKIITEASKVDRELVESSELTQGVVFAIEQLIGKCSFMGMELFDATMSTEFGGEEISFSVASPMEFVLRGDFANTIAYLEDKREEIKQTLSLISQKISGDEASGAAGGVGVGAAGRARVNSEASEKFDFTQPFNPQDFLKMF